VGVLRLAPQAVAEQLLALAPRRVLVGFSGGRDSTVLLDLLAAGPLRPMLAAIHCDHGIHPDSGQWAARCAEAAQALGVNCEVLRLALSPRPEAGLEAEARAARYAALAGRMRAGDVLVTAHHADDQAETFLLMALRGAGPAGLAAMPAVAKLGAGRHARPLLAWTRAELAAWAGSRGLRWIEDPSNTDVARDRNRIRQRVMPELKARWPAAARSLSRAAALSNEAHGLLEALADLDLAAHRDPGAPQRLPIAALNGLEAPRARNALRRWLLSLELPPPPATALGRVISEMLPAANDRMPRVSWPGAWVARYAGCLHAGATLPPAPKSTERWSFGPGQMLALPAGGALSLEPARGEGLAAALVAAAPVEVRYRHGTESIKAVGERHHRTLKKLLATQRVAPWMRARLPLIYVGGELAAVADLVVAEGFAAAADAAGLRVVWRGHPPLN
jgi:tRNA(Ile)-lysidine synthase